ncbi:MAG: hypothetical protein AB7G75_37415 [Candidatus Binatia bacterium]
MDPRELTPEDLQALNEFRARMPKNGTSLASALREAATLYLTQHQEDVISPTNTGSWEDYFADPRRPSADFMHERYNPPPQERDLF